MRKILTHTHTHPNSEHAPDSLFFGAAGAVSSCSPAMHARGLNHFPFSEEEPSKHMEDITTGGENGGEGQERKEEVNLTRGRSEVIQSIEERKKRD